MTANLATTCLGNLSSLEHTNEQPAQAPEANLLTASDQFVLPAGHAKPHDGNQFGLVSAYTEPNHKEPLASVVC